MWNHVITPSQCSSALFTHLHVKGRPSALYCWWLISPHWSWSTVSDWILWPHHPWIRNEMLIRHMRVTVPHYFLLILKHLTVFWHRDTLLPILNDAHHGSCCSHIENLRNLHKEVFLNLKSSFPNAPAAIHEERYINFTIFKDKMRIKWKS